MNKSRIFLPLLLIGLTGCALMTTDSNVVHRPKGADVYQGEAQDLVSYGETLWRDTSLGQSGLACQTCHTGGSLFKPYFKEPYPHKVDMAKAVAGLEQATAEDMVQLCMVKPMNAEPLPWGSKELAALTAYIEQVVQPEFQKK